MGVFNTDRDFGLVARVLHWLIALFVFGLFFLGLWLRSLGYYDPWYNSASALHVSFGLLLVMLVVLRVFWMAFNPHPTPLGDNRLEHAAAALAHVLLYALMVGLAVTGYLYATADGSGAKLFDAVTFPPVGQTKAIADLASYLHEWFAYAIIALAIVHIIGAFKHHLIDKDDTLRRMLTGLRSDG